MGRCAAGAGRSALCKGTAMSPPEGLIFAWRLGPDGAMALDAAGVAAHGPDDGPIWVHLDRKHPGVRAWLEGYAELDPLVAEALLEEETRPRVNAHGDGLLVNLRGVNLNPGADPEDMVSVRLWIDARRVISLRGVRLLASDDVAAELAAGRGPVTTGGVLAALVEALVARMRPVIGSIEEELDAFEEALIDDETPIPSAARISGVRRRAIELRRYLAPQRDVMNRLYTAPEPWLSATDKLELRETADRITRFVEDLDSARERGAVTHEEVSERLSLRLGRIMYVLSLVATVFLPLTFVTGLLGINVGGIPGAETGWAFLAVCTLLAALLVVEVVLFRRWRWLD